MKKKIETKGSVVSLIVIMTITIVITSILSIIGLEGKLTTVSSNNTLESTIITVNNVFSREGINSIFNNFLNNFKIFKPIIYLIFSLISISVLDKSGLLDIYTKKIKKLKFKFITILVMLISLITLYIGEYSFVYLLPLIGVIYKKIGKNPILGIITVFLTLTLGYGISIIPNYNNYILGTITQLSARIDVDKTYLYNMSSCLFIAVLANVTLIWIVSYLIETKIAIKYNNPEENTDEYIYDKKAHFVTFLTFLFCIVILVISFICGLLIDTEAPHYLAKLFGDNSPFGNGIILIITAIIMLLSYVYGKLSKNIKNSKEYSEALTYHFEKTGAIFVLMILASQFISIIEWTNVGTVITTSLLNFISSTQVSGILLILFVFILIVIMGIFIPTSVDKWILIAPIIIPLFMRSNITPDYTQFLFNIADGVGKAITPIFPYYILMLGLIEKYKDEMSFFKIFKTILPTTLLTAGILLLILIGWFLIGLPLGINTVPTL